MNAAIARASVASEWDTSGAIVPAAMPDSVNWVNPCNDEAMVIILLLATGVLSYLMAPIVYVGLRALQAIVGA